MLHILEHTAHHISPRIPLYRLPSAQRAIVAAYPKDAVEWRFNPRAWLRILAVCQLYDYKAKRWLDFDGKPAGAEWDE